MPDTPSRLPPHASRLPAAEVATRSADCDRWIREQRMYELRRALVPSTTPAGRRIIGYARTTPEGHE